MAEATSPKTKAELLAINDEVDRRLRPILDFLRDQGARIDEVHLSISGVDKTSGNPVTVRIDRTIEDHWS